MSLVEQLADFFTARPHVWIDGKDLEFAGRYAWRSRVSDLRKAPFFMTIENRQRRVQRADGTHYIVSEYKFVPMTEFKTVNDAVDMATPTLF